MKKKFSFNHLVMVLIFIVSVISVQSCNRDDSPLAPTDETTDKGHEEWAKVTFKFTKGHLHGANFHADPINPKTKYFTTVQEISYEINEKGDVVPSTQDPIRFIQGREYGLEITYYNKKGEIVNQEFVSEKMAPMHQHFFMVKNVKSLEGNPLNLQTLDLLSYTYRDTSSWDKMIRNGGELRDAKDPIGLKGYFHIKEKYTNFDLNVILVHIINGNKLDDEGNPYPFHNPSKRILGVQDLNLNIPVRVYAAHPRGDYEIEDLIKDIAKEFNISYEEAEKDWEESFNAPHDGSKYWL